MNEVGVVGYTLAMRRLLPILMLAMMPGGLADACTIPVFRYALERWTPSPYELVVLHREPLSDADQALIDSLENPGVNLHVRTLNVSQKLDDEDAALWKAHAAAALPHVLLRFPDSDVGAPLVWAGPLDKSVILQQLDSPVRRTIASRITSGESAVWVLVESGEKATDDKLAKDLEAALRSFETSLTLPEVDPDGPQLRSALPLKIAFSVVRFSRADAAELALLAQFKQVDPRHAESNEALVIPVIGRGRAVAVLPASRFSPQVLENFARFVCGECSCEIKEQNPGIDLLMTADWESIFAPGSVQTAEPTTGIVAGSSVPIPPGVAKPPADQVVPHKARSGRYWIVVSAVVAGLVMLLSSAVALRARRRRA